MSPEELLQALEAQNTAGRELLADMRSMEKTIRLTTKEAQRIIGECMDSQVEIHVGTKLDSAVNECRRSFKDVEARVQRKLDREVNQILAKLDLIDQKIGNKFVLRPVDNPN